MIIIRSTNISNIADKLPSFTWANKPASGFVGRARITDVGIEIGSVWYCDGTNWKPNAPIVLHRLISPTTTSNGTAEELIAISPKLPGDLLGIGRQLTVHFLLTKSASAESTSNYANIGTNPNGLTSVSRLSSVLTLNTTARQLAFRQTNIVTDTTHMQHGVLLGSLNPYGGVVTNANPNVIPNISNDMYVSLTGSKTTGGIETVSCPFFEVILD